jgi:hypothetical protein
MYYDPTEPFRPVELMQAVYHTSYQAPGPYGGGVQPAPAKQRHTGLFVAWMSLLCVALLLGGVLIGILLASSMQHVTHVTPTPVLVPTATPIPPSSASASEIYHDFSAHGLAGTKVRVDTNWRCCTFAPEGGALVWTDRASGHRLDIAVFKNISEAEIDARELSHLHFSSTVVYTCLLSYDKAVPTGVLGRYVHVMHSYCH